MAKALLSSNHNWPFQRQTPSDNLIWGTTQFLINTNKQTDILVVYDEPHRTLKTHIPKENRFLFLSEPPSIKKYSQEYLSQFSVVFTPQKIEGLSKDTKQIISQLALPWHFGVKHSNRFKNYLNYDDLLNLKAPQKINEISTIISNKAMNAHHLERMETTQFLKEKLDNRFHLLGRGYQEIDDKAEGITPYAFHLVCENNNITNFWTEKLADAYLGWAFPIYSGCANIDEYFPKDSFMKIDLSKPEEALKQIEKLLSDNTFYQERISAIKKARGRVLNEYNLFAVIDKHIGNHTASSHISKKYDLIKPQHKKPNVLIRAINKLQRECQK